MATCPVCHVEFDDGSKCPLCGRQAADITGKPGAFPDSEHDNPEATSLGFRINMWGAISILSLAPLFLSLSIDIIFSKGITWSVYPICILLSLWLFGTAIFFLRKLPFFLLLAFFIITFFMFFCIDLCSGGFHWFFPIALPLIITFYAVTAMITVLTLLAKRVGFNLVAFILFGIIILAVICDISFHMYLYHVFDISWSVVIIATLLPTGGFFLYLHYILKKSIDLKKIFHM